jgi:hypothetical protein
VTLRHEMVLTRENGNQVRLVAICPGTHFNVSLTDMFAIVTRNGQDEKEYFYPKKGHKDMDGMSVEDYVKHGRMGLLSVVRPHEIIKIFLECKEISASQINQ